MNLLEMIALLILLLFAATGFWKGFVRKLASLLSLFLSALLISLLLPGITQFLKEQTPVYPYIVEQCQNAVDAWSDKIMEQGSFGGESAQGGSQSSDRELRAALDMLDSASLPADLQTQVIRNLPLPEFLQEQIEKYNNSEGYQKLNVNNFHDYVIHYMASAILNVLAFILAVLLIHIAIWLGVRILDTLFRFPGLNLVNRLAGGALGLVQGMLVLSLFFLLLSAFEAAEPVQPVLQLVRESALLNFIYDSNLFLPVVLRAAAVFS